MSSEAKPYMMHEARDLDNFDGGKEWEGVVLASESRLVATVAERDSLRAQRDAAAAELEAQAIAWDSLLVEGMEPTIKIFAASCAAGARTALLRAKGEKP